MAPVHVDVPRMGGKAASFFTRHASLSPHALHLSAGEEIAIPFHLCPCIHKCSPTHTKFYASLRAHTIVATPLSRIKATNWASDWPCTLSSNGDKLPRLPTVFPTSITTAVQRRGPCRRQMKLSHRVKEKVRGQNS